MKQSKKAWDLLSEKEKQSAIHALIAHFEMERDEKIGVISAEEILDSVLETISQTLYNKGVTDAIKVVQERSEILESDLAALLSV